MSICFIKFLIVVVIFIASTTTSFRRFGKLFLTFKQQTCIESLGEKCMDINECPEIVSNYNTRPFSWEFSRLYVSRLCGTSQFGTPQVCCNAQTAPTASSFLITPATLSNTLSDQNNALPNSMQSLENRTSDYLTEHKNYHFLPNDICGPVGNNYRIISGISASIGEFPWMALIVYNTDEGLDYRCAGSLISEYYVLTAAHCITKTILGIRLGEFNITSLEDCENGYCAPPVQDFFIEDFIVHPEYKEGNLSNDISLIKLLTPANFSYATVKPICLPIEDENLEGKNMVVSGWGLTEDGAKSAVLKKVSLSVVPMEECQETYKSFTNISLNHICAGGHMGKDTCNGDSGGPLKRIEVINGTSKYVQYGIVSYGPRYCGTQNQPAIYTKVFSYMAWILDNIEH